MDSEKSEGSLIEDKLCRDGYCVSNESNCSTTRLQRNQAEKQRRDRLNGYISELATLVPMVKNSPRPVDKVSILRLAAAHMRLNLSCLNSKKFKSEIPTLPPSVVSYLELIEKNIGGFLVVTTFTGTVLFCSKCVEDFIGYQSINLMGQSIYNFVDPKEVPFFEKKISSSILRSKNKKNVKKVIKLHLLQRPLPRSTEVRYQKMLFKMSVHSNETHNQFSKSKLQQKSKKVKHKDFGTSAVILMFIEPMKMEPKINRVYLLNHPNIYYTIHGLQGEIMYADQRIATITGYMPRDVQGTSAYQYILDTDVPIALFAQKAMFTSNDGMGLITYRLRIFDSTYIYLQSKGQIVYKENTNKMIHFICFNRWLSDEEGHRELIKFQERFAPQISDSKATDSQARISNTNSLNSKFAEQDSQETVITTNQPDSLEQASTYKDSRNDILYSEMYFKSGNHDNLPSSSNTASSTQSVNDLSWSNDGKQTLGENIPENHLLQNSLPYSNIPSETNFYNEIRQTTYQSESNAYNTDSYLIENPFQTSDKDSRLDQRSINDPSEMWSGSESLKRMNMKKELSPDLNHFSHKKYQRANMFNLNMRETFDFNGTNLKSNQYCTYTSNAPQQFSRMPDNDNFMENRVSTITQSYSSIQKPNNGFCMGKDILHTKNITVEAVNKSSEDNVSDLNLEESTTGYTASNYSSNFTDLSDKSLELFEIFINKNLEVNKVSSYTKSYNPMQAPINGISLDKSEMVDSDIPSVNELANLDTADIPIINENSTIYSNEFYKSSKSINQGNEYQNGNSSCTILENCSYENFTSHEFFGNKTGSDAINDASFYNGADFCALSDADNGTSRVDSSNTNNIDFLQPNLLTNGDHYCTSNSLDVSNKDIVMVNKDFHSDVFGLLTVGQPIGSAKQSVASVNGAHQNHAHIRSTKRMKSDRISYTAENNKSHGVQPTLLERNDHPNSFYDTAMDIAIGNHCRRKSSSTVEEIERKSKQNLFSDTALNPVIGNLCRRKSSSIVELERNNQQNLVSETMLNSAIGDLCRRKSCSNVKELERNNQRNLFSDDVLNQAIGNACHGKSSFSVEKLMPTQMEVTNFNSELYNELETFFKELPIPVNTQTQVSSEPVQSPDMHDKLQLKQSSIS